MRFLRCGCFTILIPTVLIVVWQLLPSFEETKTTRFSLLPASAEHVMSTRDITRLGKGQGTYFPVADVPAWFAAANLKPQDVASLAIVNTLGSKALVIELNRSSNDILLNVQQKLGSAQIVDGLRVVQFPPPQGESSSQKWWWAVANERSLVVGHPVAVREILSVALGSRPSLSSRSVLKPLLLDFENDLSFDLKLVPETREPMMQGAQVLADKFSHVPGAGLLLTGKGMGMSLAQQPTGDCIAKLDFQYGGPAAALFVATIFRFFRALGGPGVLSDPKGPAPRELLVERKGGLVAIHFYTDKTLCAQAQQDNTGSILLFSSAPQHHVGKRRRNTKH